MNSIPLLLVLSAGTLTAQDLVLDNARIVDPARKTVTNGAIWIVDGKVGGVGAVSGDARGERIDLGGRWVLPAFHDMHVHSFGNQAPGRVFDGAGTQATAERVLRAGVTSFLDLFNAEDYIFGLRAAQQAGTRGGAEIFASGPCFTATGGHCTEYGVTTRVIDSAADVRRHLDQLAPKRPDAIKLVYDHAPGRMPSVNRQTMDALLSGARARGIKTVVHVGTWQDVREAVEAGATAITHVPDQDTIPPDLARLIAGRGVYYIPAMVVQSELHHLLTFPQIIETPLFQALAGEPVRAAYRKGPEGLDERLRAWADHQARTIPVVRESVERLHRAGVVLLVGTDAGNIGVLHGYSVHREMAALSSARVDVWDVLAAATVNPGKFLGRAYGVGPGDQADLVVLNASPMQTLGSTQDIGMVVMRGRIVFRDGRD